MHPVRPSPKFPCPILASTPNIYYPISMIESCTIETRIFEFVLHFNEKYIKQANRYIFSQALVKVGDTASKNPGVNILPFGRIRYPGRITCHQGRITASLSAVSKDVMKSCFSGLRESLLDDY